MEDEILHWKRICSMNAKHGVITGCLKSDVGKSMLANFRKTNCEKKKKKSKIIKKMYKLINFP